MCKYLFEFLLSIILGIYPDMEFAGSYGEFILNSEKLPHCFIHSSFTLYIPTEQCTRVLIFPRPCQYFLLFFFFKKNLCCCSITVVPHCSPLPWLPFPPTFNPPHHFPCMWVLYTCSFFFFFLFFYSSYPISVICISWS